MRNDFDLQGDFKPGFTLCFLTRPGQVLMLQRNRAPNRGLWNGVGGHLEAGERPLAGILREVREETGYQLPTARFEGLLTWQGFEIPRGGLYIFSAPAPQAEPWPTDEGRLDWKTEQWACTSPEVVDNIHVFLPRLLQGSQASHYHFEYADGHMLNYHIQPVPDDYYTQVVS